MSEEKPVPYQKPERLPETSSGDPDAYIEKLRKEQGYMTLGDHLEELRSRLIRMLLWVVFFSVVAYFFFPQTWEFIMGPLKPLFEEANHRNLGVKLIATNLGDYFAVTLKIVILSGVIAALPMILYEIWKFLLPALERAGRIKGSVLLLFSVLLFWSGIYFSRYFVWPTVIQYLVFEWIPPVEPVSSNLHLVLSDYLGFFLSFHFAFGVAFELPIISIILAMMGILTTEFFTSNWRFAVLVIAVLSALITPPDVFSMIALMLPMCALYTVSGILVYIVQKRE